MVLKVQPKERFIEVARYFIFGFANCNFVSPPEYPAGSVPVCLCYWTGHITITIIIITIAIIIIKISPIIILKGSPIGLHITPQMVEIVSRERATSVDQFIIPQNAIWWCGMICPCYESSIPGPNWALILIANPHNVIPDTRLVWTEPEILWFVVSRNQNGDTFHNHQRMFKI